MKKKTIAFDMALNITAAALPVAALQLFFLPHIASRLGGDAYGLLITIIAVFSIIPITMGNVLNNIRLIVDRKYNEEQIEGDFNILVCGLLFISTLLVTVIAFIIDPQPSALSLFITVVAADLMLLNEYYIVAFRLKINYKFILIANCFKVAGYYIGYKFFIITGFWQIVYIVGELLCLVFISCTSRLWKEPLQKTAYFKQCSFDTGELLIAKTINNALVYADKLIIYPLLGGTNVSIYYAATVIGKMVSMAINPMNSVALTYLSKIRSKSDKLFTYTMGIGSILCIAGYFICILISRPLLSFLYPQFVDSAMQFVYVTTAIIVVRTLIAIADPFILRFFAMKWQILLNGLTFLIYIVLCLVLMRFFGLMGFCVGILVTNCLKLLYMIRIYYSKTAHSIDVK